MSDDKTDWRYWADEINTLRDEVERLRDLLASQDLPYDMARENGNLRGENERLRKLLNQARWQLVKYDGCGPRAHKKTIDAIKATLNETAEG